MKSKYKIALISSITGLLLTACGATPAAPTPSALPPTEVALEIVDTVSASPLPATPTAIATAIPPTDTVISPSKTPAPTKTLTPTLQYTYTPTTIPPTPTAEGWRTPSGETGLVKGREWFIFADEDTGQIGGFNVDGTGMTWYDLPPLTSLSSCVSCRIETYKNFMAYITIDEFKNSIDLIVVKFPQGEIIAQIPIASTDYQADKYVYFYQESIGVMDWSPDGEYLAIAAMPNEEWTDLYLYHKGTSYIEKIIHEEGYIDNIFWFEDNTLRYTSNIHPSEKYGAGVVDGSIWMLDLETKEKTLKDTFSYEPYWGGGCGGDGYFYQEISDDQNLTIVYISNDSYYESNLGDGVYIQTSTDEEPRLLFATSPYYYIYKWIETAERFVVGNGVELVVFDVNGVIDFRMPFYNNRCGSHNLVLSYDKNLAAIISSSGLLKIYQLDKGFHKIWTVPEPIVVDKMYWQPDNAGLIIEGLGHVYYADLKRQQVNLLIYDGAGSFSMSYGFWMSQ